jgi:hypothetical protein
MSTDYYELKKPFTNIHVEVLGGHSHVGFWVNYVNAGILVFRNEEWDEAVHIFANRNVSVAPVHTHWGGRDKGVVVTEAKRLPSDKQLISASGLTITVGEVRKLEGRLGWEENQEMRRL